MCHGQQYRYRRHPVEIGAAPLAGIDKVNFHAVVVSTVDAQADLVVLGRSPQVDRPQRRNIADKRVPSLAPIASIRRLKHTQYGAVDPNRDVLAPKKIVVVVRVLDLKHVPARGLDREFPGSSFLITQVYSRVFGSVLAGLAFSIADSPLSLTPNPEVLSGNSKRIQEVGLHAVAVAPGNLDRNWMMTGFQIEGAQEIADPEDRPTFTITPSVERLEPTGKPSVDQHGNVFAGNSVLVVVRVAHLNPNPAVFLQRKFAKPRV